MWRLINFIFPLSLCFLSLTSKDIERAFLQNNAAALQELLMPQQAIYISLPEPLAISDILLPGQARVYFGRLFTLYPTFEFFIESPLPPFPAQDRLYIQARWSFLDKKNLRQHVFKVHFLVKKTELTGRQKGWPWRIIEIRAEKI